MAEEARSSCWILVGILLLLPANLAAAEEPPEKATKYHRVLRKRPQPGYLYDRFYNAWLDQASVDSLAEFLTARAKEPGESADRLLLAFFYAKQGDDRRAIEQFRATLSEDPDNAGAWFEKAVAEARTLDFERALLDLEAASRANPNDKLAVRIAKLQGQLLVRNRQRDKAIKTWQALLSARPDDEELAEDLIELEINEGLYDEATKASQALLERTKDPYLKVVRRLRLGDIQQLAGSRADALATYRATLQQVGLGSWLEREIVAQIEQVFHREDDISGLKKEYEQMLEAYPKRIGLRRSYTSILAELGENDAAVKQFEEILKRVPGDRSYREAFIALLIKADKLAEATKQLEAMVKQHPDDPELFVRLARIHHQGKQKEQAADAVQKFLAASDQDEYSYLRAARLFEQFEFFDQAKQSYADLVAAVPDSIAARESQAAFLYRQEDKEAAREIWRKLAQTDDLNQVLRVAKTVIARHENELAFELLTNEQEQFDNDSLFLAQLIDVALALKKFGEAVPWAEQRVELADTMSELEHAVAQAAKVIERSEQEVAVMERLQELEQPSVQQACLLAELLESVGDSQQADAVLEKLGDRGGLLAASQQIRLASARRDWQKAAAATDKLIQLPGGRKSQYVRRLVEYYQRDFRIADALRWIGEWKKLTPGSISPWLTESKLLLLDGKEAEAITALRTAAREFEDSSEIRIRLAQLYSQTGKLGEAERIYWQQYETSEGLGDKLRWAEQLARVAEQQGKTEQLIEGFNERRRTNRTSIVPLLSLAQVYRVTDNYEGRRQVLTAATKIKPDDLQLLLQISRIEEQEGDWQRAMATLERAVPLDKTNRAQQQIARLHLEYGDPEDGFALLYELAGGEQSDPRDIEAIADAMCGTVEWERAEAFLLEHIEDYPNDYRLRYLLAMAQYELDNPATAIDSFAKVLDAEQELPGKTPRPTNNMNSYWSMLTSLVPPETMEMIQLTQLKYTILQHRQQRSGAFSVSVPGGASSSISMPSDVEQARRYALANLLFIAQELEEEQIETLVDTLEAHGIQKARVLIAASGGVQYQGVEPAVLLEQFPDDPTVLAYALIRSGWGQSNLDAETAVRAYELFHEPRPQLAIIAALAAASSDEAQTKLLDEAFRMMDDLEQPNTMLVMNLCFQLGGMPGRNQQQSSLPEEYRQTLSDKLIAWYPKLQNTRQYGPYVFMYVVSALCGNDTPDAYLAFLDDEVARWRMQTNRRNQQQSNPYGRSTDQFLEPPTWPPQLLADFSGLLLQTLNVNSQQRNPFGQQTEVSWDDADFLEGITKVKDPILKLLLLSNIEDSKAQIDETLAELLKAETPMLDALLLAAAWESEAGQYAEASELLQNARYLPMTRELRKHVDGSLVALATERGSPFDKDGDKEKLKDDSVWQAACAAALRLRHNRMQPNQRLLLIAALEELGLSKEAEKLDKEQALASNAMPAGANVRVYSGSRSQPKDRIQKLIDNGKRETAARALSNELLGHVRQAAAMGPNAWHYRQQYEQFRKKIAGYQMIEEVLAVLDPGDAKNFRKIGDFAVANEILGRKEDAIQYYRTALELREKQDGYRVKLLFLLAEDDMDEAAKLFDGFGKQAGMVLSGELLGRLQQHNNGLKERLDAVEVALRYLEAQDPKSNVDLTWLDGVCGMMASQMYHRNGQLPPMYVAKSQRSTNSRQSNADTVKRRDRLHERLCRGMLLHPIIASQGFKHLLAAATANETVTDEFVQLATQVLMQKPEQRRSNNAAAMQMFARYNNNSTGVPFRSPVEFLVRHAFQKQDWTVIDDQVMPALEESQQQKKLQKVNQLRELYECPKDDFLEVSRSFARRRSTQANPYSTKNQQDAITVVIDAWSDRQLDVDLLPLVQDSAKKISKSQNYHQAPGFLLRYAVALSDLGQLERLDEWLEALAEIHVGPKSKRADLIKKHNTRNNIQWNSPSGMIYVYRNLLQQMLQHPDLGLPTIRSVREAGVAPIVQNLEHYSRQGMATLFQREPKAIFTSLHRTKLLRDFGDFDPYPVANNSPANSLHQYVVYQARQLKAEKRKKFLAELKQEDQDRFGVQLLQAWMAEDAEKTKLLQQLGKRLEQIQSLDAEQQRKISLGLQPLASVVRKQPVSSEVQQLLDWIDGKQADGVNAIVEQTIKAKRLEDLQIEYHNADEWLSKNLTPLVKHSPKQATAVFFRIVDLVEDSQRRSQHNYYGEDSLAGALLARTFNRGGQQSLEIARFGLDIYLHERGKEVGKTRWGSDSFSNAIRNAFTQAKPQRKKGAKRNVKSETLAQLDNWMEELGEAFGDRPSTIYASAYVQAMQQIDKKVLEKNVIPWAREQAKTGSHTELAREIGAAAELVIGQKAKKQRKGKRLEVAPYHNFYQAAINDETKPHTWRLAIAQFLYNQEREQLPPSIVEATAGVAWSALREDAPFDSGQQQNLVSSLLNLGERNEEFPKALATNFAEAWRDRYLGTKASRQQYSGSNQYRTNSSSLLALMLKLYLRLEDETTVNKLLRTYEQLLSRRPDAVGMLVRAGLTDRAAQLLRRGWSDCELNRVSSGYVVYDQKLEEKLPEFCEKFSQSDLRYFAEGLMVCLQDPKSPANDEFVERKKRQANFAKRFSEVEFKTGDLKTRTLLLLASRGTVPPPVANSLQEESEKVDLAKAANDHQNFQRAQAVVLAYVKFTLGQGNTVPAAKVLKSLLEDNEGNDWQLSNATNSAIREIYTKLRDKNIAWKPTSFGELAPVTRKLAALSQDFYLNNRDQCHAVAVAAHVIGGQTEEFITWSKGLEDEQRKTISRYGVNDEFIGMLANAYGEPTSENLATRLMAVQDSAELLDAAGWLILTNELQVRLVRRNRDFFSRIINYKLLSKEELLDHGPEIAKAYANGGILWVSLANMQQKNEEWLLAAESWQNAWNTIPEKSKEKRQRLQLRRVEALRSAGHVDEAQQVFAELKPEDLVEKVKKSYQATMKKLGQSKPSESKPEEPKPEEPKEAKENARPSSEKAASSDESDNRASASDDKQALATPQWQYIINLADISQTFTQTSAS